MATRRDIKEAFFGELEDAVDGLVDNIGLYHSTDFEELPAVAYQVNTRTLPLNTSSASPSKVVYNDNGEVIREIYRTYEEALVTVSIRAESDDMLEDINEALLDHMSQFEHRNLGGPRSFHDDCFGFEPTAANAANQPEERRVMYGDELQWAVQFQRNYVRETKDITSIGHDIDEQSIDVPDGEKTYVTN